MAMVDILCCDKCLKPVYNQRKDESYMCYHCREKVWKPVLRKRSPIYVYREKPKRSFTADANQTHDQIKSMLDIIYTRKDKKGKPLRNAKMYAALCATLSLTGARISEIVGRKNKETKEYEVKPLQKSDIEYIEYDEHNFVRFNLPILKKRSKLKRNYKGNLVIDTPVRSPSISLDYDKDIFKYIFAYIKDKPNDFILFPIQSKTAWKFIKKHTDMWCHFFRSNQATNLGKVFSFDSIKLREYFKWSDSRMADAYVKYSDDVLMSSMLKPKITSINSYQDSEINPTSEKGLNRSSDTDNVEDKNREVETK